jgi:hypothetical protein
MKFVALRGDPSVVSSDADRANTILKSKVASQGAVELISDGDSFELRGAPVFSGILDKKETSFALGALGVSGQQADFAIKTAATRGHFHIENTRKITTEEKAQAHIMKVASSRMHQSVSHLKVDLIKEAGVIIDKETVDSILSLRFITPENASIYVDYLPELEKVSHKLAELLVASRLGMGEIKEAAAKNAMTQMAQVVAGLKRLKSKIM